MAASPGNHTRSPAQKSAPLPINTDSNNSAISSSTSTPLATPRKELSLPISPAPSHRSSFAENLRTYPPSPRAQRTHSFSGAALQELLMSPSSKMPTAEDVRFRGRDWRTIQVQEIIDPTETRFVELDTSIEETTKLLIRSGAPNVVLVRESRKTKTAIGTFGYDDLMAYLLLVLGMTQPDEQSAKVARKAMNGQTPALKEVKECLRTPDDPVYLPNTADITKATELLGSGLHRVVITKEGTSEAMGVLTQLRLVRFFWENHRTFANTEDLYARSLKELELGAKVVVAINGDKPLSDALRLMHDEGITSLPVLDNLNNVVGNISHVDTRLLTDTSAIPLLSSSCIHFISVILSERGVQDGKDSYPVFHVTPFSTLAHTVAKLCATRSHRMWIVDAPSPSTSVPPSPGIGHHVVPPFSVMQSSTNSSHPSRSNSVNDGTTAAPTHPSSAMSAVSAGQLPGATMSGRLSGVVSLTDVLNVLAIASGLHPGDPNETRRRRRRSSSSSTRARGDSMRTSAEIIGGSGERSESRGSRR